METTSVLKAISHKEKGDHFAGIGDYKQACRFFEDAVDGLNDDLLVNTLCNWSFSLCKMGEYDKGVEIINRAIDIQPGKQVAWKRKAENLSKIHNKKQDAINSWEIYSKLSGNTKLSNQQIANLQKPSLFNWF